MILIYTFLEIHSSDRHGFVAPGDGLVYVEAFDMTEAEIKSKAVEKSPVALDSNDTRDEIELKHTSQVVAPW